MGDYGLCVLGEYFEGMLSEFFYVFDDGMYFVDD